MVKSMTGYGKAEVITSANEKYIVEIRSLNGKNCDITLKTSIIPREKELEVRQMIAQSLNRGNIDLFINVDSSAQECARTINQEVLVGYYTQLCVIAQAAQPIKQLYSKLTGQQTKESFADPLDFEALLPALLRMPDAIDATATKELQPEQWELLYKGIQTALKEINDFREREGVSLHTDVLKQVDKIESYILEVEKYESERIENVKQRVIARMNELSLEPDQNRFEQEMIFYLEKLDINEEKVRLRQHCKYFRETIENEEFPGRKLGFIAQEMGREINTMGSKANHAQIQKWVVKMKDELEKIKEQSLNIL